MRIQVADAGKSKNIVSLLRQAGYRQETNRRTGEVSYARSFGGEYPRFHIYLEEFPDGWNVNLHLDQKRPSYEGSRAHSGEYDGEIVEQEMNRLKIYFVK